MTVFYCFPENKGFPSEWVKDGIAVSVIGDVYEEEPEWTEENPRPEDYPSVYCGYLVNSSALVEDWAEFRCYPETPQRIFG